MITVAVIGNHRHHHCSEAAWARALLKLGCDVVPLQVDAVAHDPDGAMEVLRRCVLVAYTRTHSPGMFLDRSWTDRWRELEAGGTTTIGIHLDRYFDLEREHLVHDGDAQFTVGTVFTADGSSPDRWKQAGVNHVPMLPAVDADELGPYPYDPALAVDVVFVGSKSYHAAYPQRTALVEFCERYYGARFRRYGAGAQTMRGGELGRLYASAKVVVGDSCFASHPDRDRLARAYTSDRLYETIGRGGFTVWPRVANMADDTGIVPYVHCGVYEPGDWEHLSSEIDHYLHQPDKRADVATAGMVEVARAHTWTHRMRDVMETVGLLDPVESVA